MFVCLAFVLSSVCHCPVSLVVQCLSLSSVCRCLVFVPVCCLSVFPLSCLLFVLVRCLMCLTFVVSSVWMSTICLSDVCLPCVCHIRRLFCPPFVIVPLKEMSHSFYGTMTKGGQNKRRTRQTEDRQTSDRQIVDTQT